MCQGVIGSVCPITPQLPVPKRKRRHTVIPRDAITPYTAIMSDALRQSMTVAEFLAWEERQESRWEFDGEQARSMTGGTLNHDSVTFGVRSAVTSRLPGGPCRVLGPNIKIIARGSVRYPDAVVTCSPHRGSATVVERPLIVFEVLSASSSRIDRIVKAQEYLAAATIQRYVILEQDAIAATVLERRDDGWRSLTLTATDMLILPEIGVTLPLSECYLNADLAGDADQT